MVPNLMQDYACKRMGLSVTTVSSPKSLSSLQGVEVNHTNLHPRSFDVIEMVHTLEIEGVNVLETGTEVSHQDRHKNNTALSRQHSTANYSSSQAFAYDVVLMRSSDARARILFSYLLHPV